jgi:hypothetical protein
VKTLGGIGATPLTAGGFARNRQQKSVKAFFSREELAFAVCPHFMSVAEVDRRRLVQEALLGCG